MRGTRFRDKIYVSVLGGASIVVANQLWWRDNYSEYGSFIGAGEVAALASK